MVKTTQKKAAAGEKSVSTEPVFQVWGWILLFWSLYRYFIHLPEAFDELFFKPLVFVLPVLWYVLRYEKRTLASLGIHAKNFGLSLGAGLLFGCMFIAEGMIANYMKFGTITITPIQAVSIYGIPGIFLLSLATAFSEELLNRGFLFQRLHEKTKNVSYATFMSTILFVLLHVPILLTTLKLQGVMLVLFFMTNLILGLTNSLLMYNTRSLVAPILVHVFWNMTVALFL